MTTLAVDVTGEWVDIKTSLSLTEDTSYIIDNVIGDVVYVSHNGSTPTDTIGQPIYAGQNLTVITTKGLTGVIHSLNNRSETSGLIRCKIFGRF